MTSDTSKSKFSPLDILVRVGFSSFVILTGISALKLADDYANKLERNERDGKSVAFQSQTINSVLDNAEKFNLLSGNSDKVQNEINFIRERTDKITYDVVENGTSLNFVQPTLEKLQLLADYNLNIAKSAFESRNPTLIPLAKEHATKLKILENNHKKIASIKKIIPVARSKLF